MYNASKNLYFIWLDWHQTRKSRKPDTVTLLQTVDLGKCTYTNIHIFTRTPLLRCLTGMKQYETGYLELPNPRKSNSIYICTTHNTYIGYDQSKYHGEFLILLIARVKYALFVKIMWCYSFFSIPIEILFCLFEFCKFNFRCGRKLQSLHLWRQAGARGGILL